MLYQDFAAQYVDTVAFKPLAERPDGDHTTWSAGTAHVAVTIAFKPAGELSFTYSSGALNVVDWVRRLSHREQRKYIPDGGPMPRHGTVMWQEVVERARMDFTPTTRDVLESIQCDVRGVLDYASFEEWAADVGYDSDSRAAERVFIACRSTAYQLRAILGAVGFEDFCAIDFDADDDDDDDEVAS